MEAGTGIDAREFDYDLPEHAIAQAAVEPRDSSRLLAAASLEDHRFWELGSLLRTGDLVVVNRTRVRAARLFGTKVRGGGRVEVLLTKRLDADRWEALVRPARRVHVGTVLDLGRSVTPRLVGEILVTPQRGVTTVRLTTTGGADVEDAIEEAGEVPLPPYYHGGLEDDERYQTMFATTLGSAAAPTAALHFTPRVVADLAKRGIEMAQVDLEVGLDTFRPMDDGPIAAHQMHRERFTIPESTAEAVARARPEGRVVAIGTTVVRALETAAVPGHGVRAVAGDTDLFITPGFDFRVVDALVTNFHAPRTTLIVLVAAFAGPRWRVVYRHALESGYRFLSFGDAVLLERAAR